MAKFPSNAELTESEFPYLIAEIGINHNGDLELAKKLINIAKLSGFNAVKFQKRTIEVVYTSEELDKPRESIYGATNRDLKIGLEFSTNEYSEINEYCKSLEILWFASPWDVQSVDFLEQFDIPVYKIASACLTDSNLLTRVKQTGKPVILSTGMSTMSQIDSAIKLLDPSKTSLLHCVSTYPAENSDLNLEIINTLKESFKLPVGYSGHEKGVLPSVIAVASYKASIIERHITLDRTMWGSDQAASLEPQGMYKLIKYINESIECRGDKEKIVLDSELPVLQKLRRVSDF